MPETLTKESILKQVSFKVKLSEIFVSKSQDSQQLQVVPRKKAIVRADNNQILNIVSDKYKLIPHDQILRDPLTTLEKEGYSFKRLAVKNGGQSILLEAVGQEQAKVGKDNVFPRLLIINSYDYSHALTFVHGVFRQVCSNGLITPHELFRNINTNFKKRHTGDLEENLGTFSKLGDFSGYFQKSVNFYNRLVEIKYDDETARQIISTLYPSPKSQEEILHLWPTGDGHNGQKSGWTLFNALTQYQRDRERKEEGTSKNSKLASRVLQNTTLQLRFFKALKLNYQ